MPRRVRMSPVDTAWLRVDSPSHLMAIKGVLVLDRPLSLDQVHAVLQDRLVARFPRFRQKVVQDEHGAWWVDDPRFALKRHVSRHRLRGAHPQTALQDRVSRLSDEPLPPDRPLWAIELIEHGGPGCALVVRVHHCIADGLALVAVMLSLTDGPPGRSGPTGRDPAQALPNSGTDPLALRRAALGAEPVVPRPPAEAPSVDDPQAPWAEAAPNPWTEDPWAALLDPLTEAGMDSLEAAQAIRYRFEQIAADPQARHRFHLQGAALLGEMLKLLVIPQDTPTRYKRASGARKRVAWAEPIVLEDAKALARYLGCTVHDLVLSCAAGALRDHLLEQGDGVLGTEIRALVPVNLRRHRRFGDLGNRFGLGPVLLPLHEGDPLRRLALVRRRMAALKASMLPPVSLGLMGLIGRAPAAIQQAAHQLLSSKATAVITHVPGPVGERWLAGACIEEILFWVPQSGDIGLGMSILSYAGRLQFGLIADDACVPDPQRVARLFVQAFDNLLYGVLMQAD